MASIGNEKNGRRRVLFYDSSGKRHTVRLGTKSKRIAQTAKYHIEALLDAKINGHSPASETSQWLAGLDDVIYNRLVNVELVPARFMKSKVELGRFLSEYLESRTDVKTGTKRNWRQCINRLNTFFGASKPLTEIIEGDADAYKVWLKEQGLATATISMQIKAASQFFKAALRKQYIDRNPFSEVKAGKQTNADRLFFVIRETICAVLEACPNTQWQLVFAFARYGGVRIPSEIKFLRWADINWDRNRITITVPKKAHIDGEQTRVIPIFPELRPFLEKAFEEAAEGEEYVVPLARQTGNLRTHALRIIKNASVKVWPKVFQNLRASRETELMQHYPQHVVLAWIGHTASVARDHYLTVTDADFDLASGKAARNAARSVSASSHQGPSQPTGSKENPVNTNTTNKPVRPEGFEPPTLGSEDRCSIQLSYGRAEHSVPTVVSICDGLAQSFKTDSVRHRFGG